jgi:hypothetical protein
MVYLEAEEIMRLRVTLGEVKVVGTTGPGRLVVIPITGGTIHGEKIEGKVVPGGADWNVTLEDGIAHVFAKYLLETNDSEWIAIENEGLIGPDSQAVIKTVPKFMANQTGKYRFLNHGVFVGELSAIPGAQNSVDITIYKMW